MLFRAKLLSGVLLAVACAIGIGSTPSALAQNPRTLTAKSIFDVNIRAAPGITSAVIGTLAAGEEAVAIGRSTENNWVQIQYQGTTGWAAAWLLVFPGDTFQLPVTTDVQPAPILTGSALSAISPYTVSYTHLTLPTIYSV